MSIEIGIYGPRRKTSDDDHQAAGKDNKALKDTKILLIIESLPQENFWIHLVAQVLDLIKNWN